MIDFRYHLVSIVSIFLALAVGIVLGAGPLKEDLGTTLTDQVTQLRQDRNELRTQLDASRRGVEARDAFVAAVAPALTKDALAGRTVTVVVAPGAARDLVGDVTTALTDAGAQVGSTVTLAESWTDPEQRTFRGDLAGQLAGLVSAGPGASNPDQLISTVLARSLLSATEQGTDRVDPGAKQALDGLVAGDLVQVAPAAISLSSSAVLVGGAVDGTDPQVIQARLDAYVQLAQALDAAGAGTVVTTAANPADPRTSVGVVSAVRADDAAARVVSTVDDADLVMGRTTLVLALAREYADVTGRYGLASDATAVAPDPAPTTAK